MPHPTPPPPTFTVEEVTRIGRMWAFTVVTAPGTQAQTRTRYRTDPEGRGLYLLRTGGIPVWEQVAWCPPDHRLPRRRDVLDEALRSLFKGRIPMMNSPDHTTPNTACVCACSSVHPPARVTRCTTPPIAYRTIRAPGVGLVAMPVCHSCNSAWAAIGRGTLHSER